VEGDMMDGFSEVSYDGRLKELGLTILETIRQRADQIEVFKIVNGDRGAVHGIRLVMDKGGMRGHFPKLCKFRARLEVGIYMFSNRISDLWNGLAENVDALVGARSVKVFMGGLDKYLRDIRGLI